MPTNDLLLLARTAGGAFAELILSPVAGKVVGFNSGGVPALLEIPDLSDLAPVALSGSASDLTEGTLSDALLSANVPLLTGGNLTITAGSILASGYISSDAGQFFTDGSGNISANDISANDINVWSLKVINSSSVNQIYGSLFVGQYYQTDIDGYGNILTQGELTVFGPTYLDGNIFTYGELTAFGPTYLDSSLIQTDGNGNISIIGATIGNLNVSGTSELDSGNIITDGNGNITGSSLILYQGMNIAGPSYLDNQNVSTDGNGNLNAISVKTSSGLGAFGKTPPTSKPATPTTLAGVIVVLQSFGFCA
jgi:hypothetical protein